MDRALKQMRAMRKAIIPLCHASTTTPERGIAQKERDEWKSEPLFMWMGHIDQQSWGWWAAHMYMKMCVTGPYWSGADRTTLKDGEIEKLNNNKGFPSTCVHHTIERRDIGEKRTWKMRDKARGKEEETGRKEERRLRNSRGYERRREEKPRQLTGQERRDVRWGTAAVMWGYRRYGDMERQDKECEK